MTIDVGPADATRFLATDLLVWFQEAVDLPVETWLAGIPVDQRFAAQLDESPADGYPGIYGVRPMDLGVPGDRIPVAGLTWVGVHPDFRRRGILSAMLRDHFERSRAAGRAVSALHASEHGIYGRFGYGMAALELAVDLGRGSDLTAAGLDQEAATLDLRLAASDGEGLTERMRAVDLELATRLPGMIIGSETFYGEHVRELPHELRDKEQSRVLFAQHDGADVGYAAFRRTGKWENARPGGTVRVGMLHGEPATKLALLRRLLALDLMGTISLTRVAADSPLFAWVGGHRGTSDIKTYDSTWIRLVDLPVAWAARRYEGACDVVVEVEDRFAPWNSGRWRLMADNEAGRAERTDADAELSLDVNILGAAYLGRSVTSLLGAGLVREHRPGAFFELAGAMRTALEPEPSMGF